MVFERLDGSFCGVLAVQMWRHQLETLILFPCVILYVLGTFIIEDMQLRFEAADAQHISIFFVVVFDV